MAIDRVFIRRLAKITTVICFCLCVVLSITVALITKSSPYFEIFVVLLVLCLSLTCSGLGVLLCSGQFSRLFRQAPGPPQEGARVELSTSDRLFTIFGSRRGGRPLNSVTPDLDYEAPPPYDEAVGSDEIPASFLNHTRVRGALPGPCPATSVIQVQEGPKGASDLGCQAGPSSDVSGCYVGTSDVSSDVGSDAAQSMLGTSSETLQDSSVHSSEESVQTVMERASSCSPLPVTRSTLAIPEACGGPESAVVCDETAFQTKEDVAEENDNNLVPPPYPGEREELRQFRVRKK